MFDILDQRREWRVGSQFSAAVTRQCKQGLAQGGVIFCAEQDIAAPGWGRVQGFLDEGCLRRVEDIRAQGRGVPAQSGETGQGFMEGNAICRGDGNFLCPQALDDGARRALCGICCSLLGQPFVIAGGLHAGRVAGECLQLAVFVGNEIGAAGERIVWRRCNGLLRDIQCRPQGFDGPLVPATADEQYGLAGKGGDGPGQPAGHVLFAGSVLRAAVFRRVTSQVVEIEGKASVEFGEVLGTDQRAGFEKVVPQGVIAVATGAFLKRLANSGVASGSQGGAFGRCRQTASFPVGDGPVLPMRQINETDLGAAGTALGQCHPFR